MTDLPIMYPLEPYVEPIDRHSTFILSTIPPKVTREAEEGQMYYSSASQKVYVFDGAGWVEVKSP